MREESYVAPETLRQGKCPHKEKGALLAKTAKWAPLALSTIP